jgi:hypothetical protein
MRTVWCMLGFAVVAFAEGCGSNDCTETATCAAPPDGSAGDVVGVDAPSGDGPGVDGTTGHDSGSPGDASTDAMTVPDVVFIDAASCPTGSQCVDAVPAGWAGPLVLSDQSSGPPAPTPPACPASYPTDAYDGHANPTSPVATCGCTCGSITGADCNSTTPLGVTLYAEANCMGPTCSSDSLPYTTQGFCVGTGCAGPTSARVSLATVENASCPAMPSQNVPAWAWSETARTCQATSVGGGCSGAQVCVPTPPSPFSAQLCILQSGDVACPTGSSYSQKHTYYASVTDTRGCSTCTCTPSGITCSGGTVSLATGISGSMCAGTMVNVPTDGNCYPVSIGAGGVFAWTTAEATPSGGTCTASGGTATGTVTPGGPTTVCCQP